MGKKRKKNKIGGWSIYSERDSILRKLGYESYKAYLASDLWKDIRARVFRKRGGSCYLCPAPAVSVHHNRYTEENLTGKSIGNLFPICYQCHEGVEFTEKKAKSPPNAVFKRFGKLLNKRNQLLNEQGTPRKPKGVPYIEPSGPLPFEHCPSKCDGVLAVITLDMVMGIRSEAGGWNRHQLRVLGVGWPPRRGWTERFRGEGITLPLRAWEIAVANIKKTPELEEYPPNPS